MNEVGADTSRMKLHREQRGLKGVELGMGLFLVGMLAALAIPLMSQVRDQVADVAAAVEERAALIEAGPLADEVEVEVAGVQLVRAADGATCRWSTSSTGLVLGVWASGESTLYGRFESQLEECPVAIDARAAGFSEAPGS